MVLINEIPNTETYFDMNDANIKKMGIHPIPSNVRYFNKQIILNKMNGLAYTRPTFPLNATILFQKKILFAEINFFQLFKKNIQN